MKKWKDFVSDIPEKDLRQIIEDTKEFEKDGHIGDCVLRKYASEWCENVGNCVSVVLVMNSLSTIAFRHFAELYLAQEVKS